MGAREDIARLLKEAAASIKSDAKSAVAKLESADALARGWARRKSASRSLYYASKASKLAPEPT